MDSRERTFISFFGRAAACSRTPGSVESGFPIPPVPAPAGTGCGCCGAGSPPARFTVRLVRTPLCFQPGEEPLHILRGQPVQRDMTQPRSDVQPEAAFVDPPCAGTGGRSAVRLIPVLHPVPEWHIRIDPRRRGRRGRPSAFSASPHTLRFCFSQHIFRFRQTLVIVADDHASFPSAVLSQADSSFSVFFIFLPRLQLLSENIGQKFIYDLCRPLFAYRRWCGCRCPA